MVVIEDIMDSVLMFLFLSYNWNQGSFVTKNENHNSYKVSWNNNTPLKKRNFSPCQLHLVYLGNVIPTLIKHAKLKIMLNPNHPVLCDNLFLYTNWCELYPVIKITHPNHWWLDIRVLLSTCLLTLLVRITLW